MKKKSINIKTQIICLALCKASQYIIKILVGLIKRSLLILNILYFIQREFILLCKANNLSLLPFYCPSPLPLWNGTVNNYTITPATALILESKKESETNLLLAGSQIVERTASQSSEITQSKPLPTSAAVESNTKLTRTNGINKNKPKLYNYFNNKSKSIASLNNTALETLPETDFTLLPALDKANKNKVSFFVGGARNVKVNKELNFKFNKSMGTALLEKEINEKSLVPCKANNLTVKGLIRAEDIEKILISFFKSIYTLISKPIIIITPDKIIIEILYFITIPDANLFKWYNLFLSPKKNQITALQLPYGYKGEKINQRKIRYLKGKNKLIKTILYKNNYIKNIFYKLNKININKLYNNKFNLLFNILNSYFYKPINLDLIRIHHSYFDSNILAQLFSLIVKKKNIKKTIYTLFSKNIILNQDINFIQNSAVNLNLTKPTAFISGLYIHIGGRLTREPIIPRMTKKKYEKGTIATGKINNLDIARITKKNKKGAFTIKIIYAQNFIA